MPDQPQLYYDALPEALQHFEMSGPHDRAHYFLLYMFLGDIPVIDYLVSRRDWDGKTLVVTLTRTPIVRRPRQLPRAQRGG